jgi:hypothetical protein
VCDKHAKETTRNTATFHALAFIILLRRSQHKVPEHVPKNGQWAMRKEKAKESRSFPLSKRMNRPACKTDIWILPQGTAYPG